MGGQFPSTIGLSLLSSLVYEKTNNFEHTEIALGDTMYNISLITPTETEFSEYRNLSNFIL